MYICNKCGKKFFTKRSLSGHKVGKHFLKGKEFGDKVSKSLMGHIPWNKGLRGFKCSEETKIKLREKNKGNPKIKEGVSKALKELWKTDKYYREKQLKERRQQKGLRKDFHNKACLEEMAKLREQGFKVIPLLKAPMPDLIAVKDGKVNAVEVEIGEKIKRYDRYNQNNSFDDIIWILRKRRKY